MKTIQYHFFEVNEIGDWETFRANNAGHLCTYVYSHSYNELVDLLVRERVFSYNVSPNTAIEYTSWSALLPCDDTRPLYCFCCKFLERK